MEILFQILFQLLFQDQKGPCWAGGPRPPARCITRPPSLPIFGLRGGGTAINQIFLCCGGAGAEVLSTDSTGAGLQPSPGGAPSTALGAMAPPLWIRVDLIRNRSDVVAKITFISRTMINAKGITQSPEIKAEEF